jgi:hypothetical protein
MRIIDTEMAKSASVSRGPEIQVRPIKCASSTLAN